MMRIVRQVVNLFRESTFLAYREGAPGCVVIDPGAYAPEERDALLQLIRKNGLVPEAILLTHGHTDHIFFVKALQDMFGIPVYVSREDEPLFPYSVRTTRMLGLIPPETDFRRTDIADGQVIRAAGLSFTVIRTPGHSPGSSCFWERDERVMFTGDTLFAGTIGRTDLMLGEYDDEIRSIMDKLMPLDGDIRIYPGHGPESTIGTERTGNPMLEPWGEAETEAAETDALEIHGI